MISIFFLCLLFYNNNYNLQNAASGADSGSYSDSDSASSHRSSSSSKCKHVSSPSSRSNTPPSNYEDRQQFSVRETNFEQVKNYNYI